MSDEDAILAAISAHPEEDTPRLAYADWLDEHGSHIKAEFIRVQIAVNGLVDQPSAEQGKQIHLFRRQQELLDDHLSDLIGPLAADLGYFDVIFDRGFVAELKLDAGRLLKHADAIRALKPLPEITVWDVAWWLQEQPAEGKLAEELQLASAIIMQSDKRFDPIPLDAGRLAGAFIFPEPWPRLRKLDVSRCGIGDAGLVMIVGNARIDYFPALTHLDVTGYDIGDEGVRMPGVRHFSLPKQDQTLSALVSGINSVSGGGWVTPHTASGIAGGGVVLPEPSTTTTASPVSTGSQR